MHSEPADSLPAPSSITGRPGPRRPGLRSLDAAALILAASPHPLGAKQLVACMTAKRLWVTRGRTPQAVVAAALSRDIRLKQGRSRFRKAGPGLFAANTR